MTREVQCLSSRWGLPARRGSDDLAMLGWALIFFIVASSTVASGWILSAGKRAFSSRNRREWRTVFRTLAPSRHEH